MRAARLKYKAELLEQVKRNDVCKTKEKEMRFAESREKQKALERRKEKLVSIKDRKIEELKKEGVPDKYIAELAKKKIET